MEIVTIFREILSEKCFYLTFCFTWAHRIKYDRMSRSTQLNKCQKVTSKKFNILYILSALQNIYLRESSSSREVHLVKTAKQKN